MPKYNIDGKSYFFEKDIGQEKAEELIALQNSESSGESDTYEGFFTEAGEGVASGLLGIVEGVTTLPTLAFDLIAGTNSTEFVEQAFDQFKEDNGIDPEGLAGTVTEAIIQYGIPGIGAASVAGRLGRVARIASGKSKIGVKSVGLKDARQLGQKYGNTVKGRTSALSKSQRAGVAAQQITGAFLADAIVATDGTQTLGDFFESGPTETVDTVGLEGRDKAFQKILNKLKVGVEGGVATGILPPVLGTSLTAISKVAAARPLESIASGALGKATTLDIASGFTIPAIKKTFDVTGKALTDAKEKIYKDPTNLSTLDQIVGHGAAMLTYGGFLDPIVARAKALVNPEIEGATKRATQRMKEIDKEIKKTLKSEKYRALPDIEKKKIVDNFMDVLDGVDVDTLTELPQGLKILYSAAKRDIDNLSNKILNTAAFKALPEEAAVTGQMTQNKFRNDLNKNMSSGGYLRRLYRIFNDKDYVLKADDKSVIIDKIKSGEGVNYGHVKGLLKDTAFEIDDTQMASLMSGTSFLTERQAKAYVDKYLTINKERGGRHSGAVDRIFKVRLDTSLLSKRKVDSEVQRLILGEVKDPREAYVATIAELSNFIASDKMLDTFRQSADASILSTLAKNAENVTNNVTNAQGEVIKEGQVFFKMDDEILKIIKNNPDMLEKGYARGLDEAGENIRITDPNDINSVSQLDDRLIGDAIEKWQGNNPGFEILGRTSQTAGNRATNPLASSVNSVFGSMFGYAVPKAMYNNMSSKVWADSDAFPMMLRYLYQPMMSLKGVSQYAKTILSPITQVRNVTSAAMFALANGNFGKGSSLGTSVNVVLKDIIDRELKLGNKTFDQMKLDNETLSFLTEMQERGVIGSSAQLREIQDNLRKGLGYDRQGEAAYGAKLAEGGDEVSDARGNPNFKATERSKLKQFMKTPFNAFENLYRGGDDIWKIYNYTFEMNKFRNARRKMHNAEIKKVKKGNLYKSLEGDNQAQLKLIGNATRLADEDFGKHIAPGENIQTKDIEQRFKQFAADNVRNLVPNYELVPEAITGLRGLPFGDFIAFPAEILRTGFNIMDVSMKELSSNSSAIREIGARRMMGAVTSFGLLGTGLQEFGKSMTGTSSEEMDAYNRLAAPYQRNSQFIPLGKNKDGNPEVMDFSHTNPYAMLAKPLHTMLRNLREGSKLDKGGVENTTNAMFEALAEFVAPFAGVSMIYEAAIDIAPRQSGIGRGGETVSGAKVYKDADTPGKKLEKSLIHLLDTIMPNMVPLRVPTGADLGLSDFSFTPVKSPEISRFVRGTFMEQGSIEPTTGREYTSGGELFRAFTGLNTQVIDRKKVLGFKSQEFKSDRSSAASLFNDVFYLENPSRDTFIEGYARADNARFKIFKKLKLVVDDIRKLGLDDVEIRQIMKAKGVGRDEINSVLNDMYRSFRPNKDKRKEALRKGIDYPFSEIQDLIDLRDFLPLSVQEPIQEAEDKKDPLDLSLLSIQEPESNTTSNVASQSTTVPTSPVLPQASLDQVIFPSAATRNVADFLGSNLDSRAKNMDIARRTA